MSTHANRPASIRLARRQLLGLLLGAALPLRLRADTDPQPLQHYLYFHSRGDAGASLRNEAALRDPRFAGAQVAYPWRLLEPAGACCQRLRLWCHPGRPGLCADAGQTALGAVAGQVV